MLIIQMQAEGNQVPTPFSVVSCPAHDWWTLMLRWNSSPYSCYANVPFALGIITNHYIFFLYALFLLFPIIFFCISLFRYAIQRSDVPSSIKYTPKKTNLQNSSNFILFCHYLPCNSNED